MPPSVEILDGGMGVELMERGVGDAGGVWSARALLDAPEAVVDTHRAYIDAGARVITTNSYSTIPSYLGKEGLEERYEELAALAGSLARRAAEESGLPVRVAGSLPPLDESYRPDLAPPDEEARAIYRRLARALEPHVDLFLCETMSCVREAVNAATMARETASERGLPVYVSFTLNEKPGVGLRSRESIEAAFEALEAVGVDAYLCNCTSPQAVEAAVARLCALTDKPVGGYPNRLNEVPEGFTLDEADAGMVADLPVEAYVASARRCIDAGATIFGGCCGIGPTYIAALAKEVGAT